MPKRQWQATLPPRRPRTYDWHAIVAELQSRPGEWMLIGEDVGLSTPGAINRQKMVAFRSDEWTYETRTFHNNRETGTCELWLSATRKEG